MEMKAPLHESKLSKPQQWLCKGLVSCCESTCFRTENLKCSSEQRSIREIESVRVQNSIAMMRTRPYVHAYQHDVTGRSFNISQGGLLTFLLSLLACPFTLSVPSNPAPQADAPLACCATSYMTVPQIKLQ